MSKIKRFLEHVVEVLQQNPNVSPQAVLSKDEYKFYKSNQNYIDTYVEG